MFEGIVIRKCDYCGSAVDLMKAETESLEVTALDNSPEDAYFCNARHVREYMAISTEHTRNLDHDRRHQ